MQAIFPKIQVFVDDFHAGKAAGQNGNAAASKPIVKDHTAAQQAAAAKSEAVKPSPVPSSQPSKKTPASSTAAGIKRGNNRIDFKETFYCCESFMSHTCSVFPVAPDGACSHASFQVQYGGLMHHIQLFSPD
jgi:hypothetical protein